MSGRGSLFLADPVLFAPTVRRGSRERTAYTVGSRPTAWFVVRAWRPRRQGCDRLAFNPSHTLAEDQPRLTFSCLFSLSSRSPPPSAPCSPPPASHRYISFTTDACPKDELDGGGNCKRAGSWLRAIYNDRDDATPVYFAGVPNKPHVYKLFNTWYGNSGQYQNWFTADVAGGGWISTSVHQSEAMEIMVVPANGGAGGNNKEDGRSDSPPNVRRPL